MNAPTNAPTKEEMLAINDAAVGNISDWNNRLIIAQMLGYLTHTTNLDDTRAFFFDLIKRATKDQTK